MKFIVYNAVQYACGVDRKKRAKIMPSNLPHYVVRVPDEDTFIIKRVGRGNHTEVDMPACFLRVRNRKGELVRLENSATWDYIQAYT